MDYVVVNNYVVNIVDFVLDDTMDGLDVHFASLCMVVVQKVEIRFIYCMFDDTDNVLANNISISNYDSIDAIIDDVAT